MIFAVHGFLGSASEWNEIIKLTKSETWVTPSLFEDFPWPSAIDFKSVVLQLREFYYLPAVKSDPTLKKIFLGYSLGGRIGLQWLELFPKDFERWIFLSTNPGFTTESEKDLRFKSDLDWVAKLQKLDQLDFLQEWNAQPVFANTRSNASAKLKWDKDILAAALLNLSLSRQNDFSEVLKTHREQIDWIVGKSDQKFLDLALKLKEGMKIQHLHPLLGGHRIYLDQPQPIADLLLEHRN